MARVRSVSTAIICLITSISRPCLCCTTLRKYIKILHKLRNAQRHDTFQNVGLTLRLTGGRYVQTSDNMNAQPISVAYASGGVGYQPQPCGLP